MPRQPPQHDRRPFTKLLSTLRKPELVRLCDELELPSDGSVLSLRDRAKRHLTQNANLLFRNPRYKQLYPKHRRTNRRTPSPTSTLPSRTPSVREPSPAQSFESWHGIEEDPPQPEDFREPSFQPSPQPYQPPDRPVSPLDYFYVPPDDYQEVPFQPNPFPTPAPTGSRRGSFPPAPRYGVGREFHVLLLPLVI
jgi:hypothetical protein